MLCTELLYCIVEGIMTRRKCLNMFSIDAIFLSKHFPSRLDCVSTGRTWRQSRLPVFLFYLWMSLTSRRAISQWTFVESFLLSILYNYTVFTSVCIPPWPHLVLSSLGLQPQQMLSGLLNYIKDGSLSRWCGLLSFFSLYIKESIWLRILSLHTSYTRGNPVWGGNCHTKRNKEKTSDKRTHLLITKIS